MGPTIILDKSAFQGLSFDEIKTLHNYFFVVVPPILIWEILADLSKNEKTDIDSQKKVKLLSQRIINNNSKITTDFNRIIVNSLLGYEFKIERKPVIFINNSLIKQYNTANIILPETPVEKLLLRCKNGSFSDKDFEFAKKWRKDTTKINKLQNFQRQIKEFIIVKNNICDLKNLKQKLDEQLKHSAIQKVLLKAFIKTLPINSEIEKKIVLNWEKNRYKNIKELSPFAYYCLNINLFFLHALGLDLISTRATNDLDLRYLFYLPFCNIFSTNDKFQKKILPFYLEKDQLFIPLDELKTELKRLSNEENNKEYSYYLKPKIPGTLTFKLWEKYVDNFPKSEVNPIQKFINDVQKTKINNFEQSNY